ncbi:MAG TPA: YceD family protein [Candidatus Paceibacterota bacterium]|nr:YceD family protein [Candidatus Paceibacterota bacterium]
MKRESQVFRFNAHDLPRRAGEMREYSLDIPAPDRIGIDVIAVLPGEEIHMDMRLESVTQGVLVSAQLSTIADGECMRCLESVEFDIERRIQELYRYEPEKAHTKAQRKRASAEEDDLDLAEELMMEGDIIDLEAPIRDAIVLSLPINPLCAADCPGLCPGCGVKWTNLPADHAHQVIDARWSGLTGLLPDESIQITEQERPDFKN